MFSTLFRRFAREAHVGEAAELGSLAVILRIVKENGPCNKRVIWKEAEEAGVKSLRHMKLMLRWLQNAKQVQVKAIPRTEESKHMAESMAVVRTGRKKKGVGTAHPTKEFVYSVIEPR